MSQAAANPAGSPVGMTVIEVAGYHDPVIPISLGALTGGQLATARAVHLLGWALRETSGSAAAALSLYTGGSASGQLLAPINLSAGESTRDWFGNSGVYLPGGLFANVESGSVLVVVWVRICTGDYS